MRCTGTGDYIKISGLKQLLVVSEKFPDETFDPVATNGITDPFRDGNAESWMFHIIATANDYEVGCIAPGALSRNTNELGSFTKSHRLGERGHQRKLEITWEPRKRKDAFSPLHDDA